MPSVGRPRRSEAEAERRRPPWRSTSPVNRAGSWRSTLAEVRGSAGRGARAITATGEEGELERESEPRSSSGAPQEGVERKAEHQRSPSKRGRRQVVGGPDA